MLEELNGDFLQWLRGFYYTAKTGSVRAAAEHMHRSPSAISYQLHALESALHTVLFDRYKKALQITPEGRELLAWTVTTFENLQSMMSSVGGAGGELRGSVFLSATLPFAAMVLDSIASFRGGHPNVNVHLHRALPAEVMRFVNESRVDFGLVGLASLHAPPDMEIFFKSRPLLVCHRDAPWNIPRVPSFADLANLPYIAFSLDGQSSSKDLSFRDSIPEGMLRNAVLTVNNHHLILRLVLKKVGVAFVDEMSFLATTSYGASFAALRTVPLDHLLPNSLYGILLRRQRRLSPQAKALLEDIRSAFLALNTSDCREIWTHLAQQVDVEVKTCRTTRKKSQAPAR